MIMNWKLITKKAEKYLEDFLSLLLFIFFLIVIPIGFIFKIIFDYVTKRK